ncbi:hypothetical protein BU15DRAFT_67040 [Melanogaster broomeanus]|nr:hypothetical protein BU15DRAFT_67040 [Melanogaster broomeanus]
MLFGVQGVHEINLVVGKYGMGLLRVTWSDGPDDGAVWKGNLHLGSQALNCDFRGSNDTELVDPAYKQEALALWVLGVGRVRVGITLLDPVDTNGWESESSCHRHRHHRDCPKIIILPPRTEASKFSLLIRSYPDKVPSHELAASRRWNRLQIMPITITMICNDSTTLADLHSTDSIFSITRAIAVAGCSRNQPGRPTSGEFVLNDGIVVFVFGSRLPTSDLHGSEDMEPSADPPFNQSERKGHTVKRSKWQARHQMRLVDDVAEAAVRRFIEIAVDEKIGLGVVIVVVVRATASGTTPAFAAVFRVVVER